MEAKREKIEEKQRKIKPKKMKTYKQFFFENYGLEKGGVCVSIYHKLTNEQIRKHAFDCYRSSWQIWTHEKKNMIKRYVYRDTSLKRIWNQLHFAFIRFTTIGGKASNQDGERLSENNDI